jgi:transposase-like protein
MRFFCRTCPYVFQLKSKVTSEATLERKVVDDVLGGPDAWKNADQTEGARALPATTTSCHRHCARPSSLSLSRPHSRQPTAASAATTARTTSSCRSARPTSR